ncbi:MAG TPA: hypothetical protein VFO21_04910 [Vicinamibacterales bacterium]|nr:hypothetical protein [Vicinamibacterales bacterium]
MIRTFLMTGLMTAWAASAAAQTGVSFFPRAEFRMGAEHLSGIDDERFRWDANFGGEVDFIDYTAGRLIFTANYQAILGEELQKFDPNQGNYILAGALTARLRQTEAALVFFHQSRHLGDRPKEQPVDWNMLGGRVRRAFLLGGTYLDAQGDLRWVVQRSFVDYEWELDTRVRADRLLRPGIDVMASGGLRVLGVDGTAGRDGQTGYRAEGGFRFEGGGGAVELFVAVERRIDPYPTEFGTATWMSAGFRLLGR